jgi:hypothetical protein
MNKSMPIMDYWLSLAYPDGSNGNDGFRAPPATEGLDPGWEADRAVHKASQGKAEQDAWQSVCSRAIDGTIEIHAFRSAELNDPDLEDYAQTYRTVRERIPAEFFNTPTYIAPMAPVLIYYTEPNMPNIRNAPWRNPIVVATKALSLTSARGRSRGTGMETTDAPFVEMMRELLTSKKANSKADAAKKVIAQNAELQSITTLQLSVISRLTIGYNKKYSGE